VTTRSDLPALRLQLALRFPGLAEGTAGRARRERHADLVDRWLADLFERCADRPDTGLALAATGSLGRRDAGPLSDLDLVLLHDPRRVPDGDLTRLADALWYPIWDSGTALDHAVRTPDGCLRTAAQDWTAAIGLLDLRPIAGDADLVVSTGARVAEHWRTTARRRVAGLLEHVRERPGARDALAHQSEPDLKHASGGLRDLSVLRALAATWLVSYDRPAIDAAGSVLLDARDALQTATGRRTSTLLRSEQEAVAALCGADDADAHHAVLAEAGRTVADQLARAVRALGAGSRARRPFTVGEGAGRRPRLVPLGDGLVRQGDEISLDLRAGSRDPARVVLAARAAARTGARVSDVTLGAARGRPGPEGPWPEALHDAFVDLLATGAGFAALYEDLDLAGLVAAWVPGWDAIRNRPQRSPVHRWCVDRHLVETVALAAPSAGLVRRPDLLLLAALLHDLGKRDGARDHSAEGAPLARAAALHLGAAEEDAGTVARLVAEHLTLVELATTRDPGDDSTVTALLAAVDHDPDVLRMLRILSEADARAASPRAWTSWRARLVDHLTERAGTALAAERAAPRSAPPAAGEPRGLLARTERRAAEEARRTGAEVALGPRPDDAEETRALRPGERAGPEPLPLVIAVPDRVGAFAAMAAVLEEARLAVRAALVRTEDGIAIDTFWVRPHRGDVPDPVLLRAALDRELRRPLPPAPPRADDAGPRASVVLVPGASATATVLQINAPDRRGLLADAARVLARHGVSLRSAHVVTRAGRALDTLYLTGADGAPLAPVEIAVLVGDLMDAAAPR
jgi:[protein-PII] uridylyltransferase